MAKHDVCDIVSIGVGKGEPLIVLTGKQGHAVSIPVTVMQDWILRWRAGQAAREVIESCKGQIS